MIYLGGTVTETNRDLDRDKILGRSNREHRKRRQDDGR